VNSGHNAGKRRRSDHKYPHEQEQVGNDVIVISIEHCVVLTNRGLLPHDEVRVDLFSQSTSHQAAKQIDCHVYQGKSEDDEGVAEPQQKSVQAHLDNVDDTWNNQAHLEHDPPPPCIIIVRRCEGILTSIARRDVKAGLCTGAQFGQIAKDICLHARRVEKNQGDPD